MNIKDKKVIESFNNATEGIIEVIKSESHMKVHILTSVIIIMLALIVDISQFELLILILTISLVFITEIINTAIEKTVDLVYEEKHPLAKISKDAAAGAVLISAVASVLIGYIIFFDKIMRFILTKKHFYTLVGRMSHITVLIIALLCILVVSLKAHFRKGTAFEGGMPSGHATISASVFVIITWITTDVKIILLALLLFLLVCQSRIKSGIHTFKEVLFGSILGFSVTYIILLILFKIGNII